jgi:hypothetical protein
MPNLGDFLGQLLGEITLARVQADLEALRVAELYASHPLLRRLPVPHFRLPDVELEVPVVISGMEEPREGESPRGGLPLAELRESFGRILGRELERQSVSVTDAERRRLQTALDERLSRLSRQPREIAVGIGHPSDELASAVSEVLSDPERPGGPLERAKAKKVEAGLREAARAELLAIHVPPPRLRSLVTTAEIREAGPAETLTHLRLKISEEGMEWTSVEIEDRTEDRLVIE